MWPDRRILTLFGIEQPIILAPMAGPVLSDIVIAVANAGGLGSLPCALLSHDQARAEMAKIRAATAAPINMNFFCHRPPSADACSRPASIRRDRFQFRTARLSTTRSVAWSRR